MRAPILRILHGEGGGRRMVSLLSQYLPTRDDLSARLHNLRHAVDELEYFGGREYVAERGKMLN